MVDDTNDALQVNVVAALPAGTNAIGKLSANDGVDIGDVTINNFGVQSAIGTNSDTVTSGGNWSTNTYTGSGEQVNYQYVSVSLQTDETGTLYFDFSNDGTNWSTFPVDGFTIASGVHEYHGAHKGGRYFRPRFVGSGGRSYFRLYTYYSNAQVQLNAPLNFSMSADSDGQIVKSAHVVQYTPTPSSVSEGAYDTPSITRHREVRTRDQAALKLQRCDDYTEFTALGNDTLNLADSLNHVYGTSAVTFDKVNGAANTVYAGIQDTITSVDGQEIFEMGSFVGFNLYLPSVADVVGAFLRIGTDSSNYNEWTWDVEGFTAATWLPLRKSTSQPSGYAGNGWDPSDITYVAIGVEFSDETDTLAGIVVDNIYMVGGRVTDSTTDTSVTTSISSANINLHKVGNKVTDTNTGNASTGTLRVVLASDQPVVSIDDNGGSLTVDGTVTANLSSTDNTVLDNIDTNTSNSATSLAVLDDWDNAASDGASVSGDTAHDSADAGEPVKIGGKAKETDGTDPGSVAEDDRVNAHFDRNGRQLVNTAHPNLWSVAENHSTAQTNNALKAAPGANLSLYITDVVISNGATAGNIKFVEDTAGTPVDVIEVMYFAANGGAALHFKTPIRITANKDFGFTSVTSTTHSITVCGYTAP